MGNLFFIFLKHLRKFPLSSFFIFFIPLFIAQPLSAINEKDKARIDSIFHAISEMKEDTQTVNYINSIYNEFLWQFDLPLAYNKLKVAAKISTALHYDQGAFMAYTAMANYCIRAGQSDFSIENRLKALTIAERMNDSLKIAGLWVGLGLAQESAGNLNGALDYYFKAKPYLEKSGDKDKLSRVYTFIGWTYDAQKKDSLALPYALKALQLRKEINYREGMYSSLASVRAIYMNMKQFDTAMMYSNQSYKLRLEDNSPGGLVLGYIEIGELEEKLNNLDSAFALYNRGLKISQELNDKMLLKDIYKHLSNAYELKGDLTSSYKYYKLFVGLKDSLDLADIKIKNERTNEIYDLESKNAEIELNEKDISAQKKSLVALVLIVLVTSILGLYIFLGYRQKRKLANDLIVQKKVVDEKNLAITDSIVYAKRIQQAILPSLSQIQKALPDSFVLYQPKDIVSGDFFWFAETQNSFYIAAVDCTGHGVPGALMSMIGFNFLNQIVSEIKTEGTAEILNALHKKVLLALNKDFETHDVKDGMDIALLRIFKNKNEIEFSGAVRPLYCIENGNLNLIKGDIYSIGGIKDINAESFSVHNLKVAKGTCLYIFSDGFADQFGGPNGKKFKYKQLKEVLVSLHDLPMEKQKIKLEETFQNWKGQLEQVDDVLVIGIKM